MKLVVKYFLNVRVGAPNVNAPCYQYLAPGSEVEVDGLLYEGSKFEHINTWYKDAANNYYWSGGFEEKRTVIPTEFDEKRMSWGHKWYNLPFIWNELKTTGEGITVAVIDTGIDTKHQDLISKIHNLSKSFVGDSKNLKDNDGHGTTMAGIIGAVGNKVYGVAPGVSLLILKASEHKRGGDVKLFAQALDYAASIDEVDIISFSTVLSDDSDLRKAIEKCQAKKKVVVAAIGNARDTSIPEGPDRDTFPACYDNVIAVGAFDRTGKICTFSNWHPQLDLLAPGDGYVLTTTLNNSIGSGSGTSIATAFTSGCLALLFAYAKGKVSRNKCIEAIFSTCDDTGPSIGKDIQSGHGLMNLRNAISKL